MFRESINTSIGHSLSSWGDHHHFVTSIAANGLTYATIAFGFLWLVLNHEIKNALTVFIVPLGITFAATQGLSHVSSTSSISHLSALMGATVAAIYGKNRQAGNGLLWLAIMGEFGIVASAKYLPSQVIFSFCLGIVISVGMRRLILRLPRV